MEESREEMKEKIAYKWWLSKQQLDVLYSFGLAIVCYSFASDKLIGE